MDNIITRLLEYAKAKRYTVSAFEKELGLSNGYFNTVSRRNNVAIGSDKITTIIAKFTDLDINWLLTGNGSMTKPEPVTTIEADSTGLNSSLFNRIEESQLPAQRKYELCRDAVLELEKRTIFLERELEMKNKIILMMEGQFSNR
jgi:transcriptional regulator with XRE-family HTH domain